MTIMKLLTELLAIQPASRQRRSHTYCLTLTQPCQLTQSNSQGSQSSFVDQRQRAWLSEAKSQEVKDANLVYLIMVVV